MTTYLFVLFVLKNCNKQSGGNARFFFKDKKNFNENFQKKGFDYCLNNNDSDSRVERINAREANLSMADMGDINDMGDMGDMQIVNMVAYDNLEKELRALYWRLVVYLATFTGYYIILLHYIIK